MLYLSPSAANHQHMASFFKHFSNCSLNYLAEHFNMTSGDIAIVGMASVKCEDAPSTTLDLAEPTLTP